VRETFPKAKRVLVKIGSNVLTRSAGGGVALGRIAHIVEQVAHLRAAGREVFLVSSGAVATGKRILRECDTKPPIEQLPIPSRPLPSLGLQRHGTAAELPAQTNQQCSAVGQLQLMSLYEQLFKVYGTTVSQVLLSVHDLAYATPRTSTCRTLEALMQRGIVPIVNENDAIEITPTEGDGSIPREELVISDNDSIAAVLATQLGCDLAILLSNVDGVYEKFGEGRPISVITPTVLQDMKISYAAKSSAGRGGMDSKVKAAEFMMNRGTKVVIASGNTLPASRNLLDIVEGKGIGTVFTN